MITRPKISRRDIRRMTKSGRSYARHTAVRARAVLRPRGHVPGMISFVVPVYNVEQFLDECLLSLRQQSVANIEIVAVDDGSTDGSAEILRRHARRDPRVRVVTQENGGLSAARNSGVRRARGQFLAFVDSDDTVTHDGYQAGLDMLRQSGSDLATPGSRSRR